MKIRMMLILVMSCTSITLMPMDPNLRKRHDKIGALTLQQINEANHNALRYMAAENYVFGQKILPELKAQLAAFAQKAPDDHVN